MVSIDYTGYWTFPRVRAEPSRGPSASASGRGRLSANIHPAPSSTPSPPRSSAFPRALRERGDSSGRLQMTRRQYRADQIWGAVITATLIAMTLLMARSVAIDAEQDRITVELRSQSCQTYGMIRDLAIATGVNPPVAPADC